MPTKTKRVLRNQQQQIKNRNDQSGFVVNQKKRLRPDGFDWRKIFRAKRRQSNLTSGASKTTSNSARAIRRNPPPGAAKSSSQVRQRRKLRRANHQLAHENFGGQLSGSQANQQRANRLGSGLEIINTTRIRRRVQSQLAISQAKESGPG